MEQEERIREIDLVYKDVVDRIAADNAHAWYAILAAGAFLSVFKNVFHPADAGLVPRSIYALIVAWLVLAIVFGFLSLLAFRDIRWLYQGRWNPLRRLFLGDAGAQAYQDASSLVRQRRENAPANLFHTSELLRWYGPIARVSAASASERFRSDLERHAIADFAAYTLFLAYLIEIRKRPRALSAHMLLLGLLTTGVSYLLGVLS